MQSQWTADNPLWSRIGVGVFLNALIASSAFLVSSPLDVWFGEPRAVAYLLVAMVGQCALIFTFLGAVMFLLRRLGMPSRLWFAISIGLFSALLSVMILDARVFALYRFHLNSMVLNLLLGGAAGEVLSLSAATWVSILGACAALVLVQWLIWRLAFKQSHYRGRGIWLAVLFMVITSQLYYAVTDATGDYVVTSQLRFVPWAQPITMKRLLRKWGIGTGTQETPSLHLDASKGINYPKNPLTCTPSETGPPNILLLILDSLRYDVLTPEVMPATYAYADDSLRFDNHWSTSNSTRFGVFGLFYGLPSTYWFAMLREQKGAALIDVLVEQDYTLHLDAVAPLNSPEFDRTIFSRVRDQLQWGRQGQEGEKDTIIVDRLLRFLDSQQSADKPFFAFAFLDAAHAFHLPEGEEPYFQPSIRQVNYLALHNDYDRKLFFNLYRSTVRYNDRLVAQVYQRLKVLELEDNTIVIVTGDHGQEFNELKQNSWGHNSNFSRYQVQVPLVLRWPGRPGRVVDALTSHEDIVPTLMRGALGCSNAVSDYSSGMDLLDVKLESMRGRELLLANWNGRAIYTGAYFYNFLPMGIVQVLDKDYQLQTSEQPDTLAIQRALTTMQSYLK